MILAVSARFCWFAVRDACSDAVRRSSIVLAGRTLRGCALLSASWFAESMFETVLSSLVIHKTQMRE